MLSYDIMIIWYNTFVVILDMTVIHVCYSCRVIDNKIQDTRSFYLRSKVWGIWIWITLFLTYTYVAPAWCLNSDRSDFILAWFSSQNRGRNPGRNRASFSKIGANLARIRATWPDFKIGSGQKSGQLFGPAFCEICGSRFFRGLSRGGSKALYAP